MTSLNGVLIYPDDIALDTSKIGVTLIAANGARRFVHRVTGVTPIYKRVWTLQWEKASLAIRTIVITAHAIATTFAFVDQYGASWTVQTESDAYADSVSLIAVDGTTLYYSITLKIFQT